MCSGTIEDAPVETLIAGLVHTLMGMKPGEERWAALHPSYAYGNHSFFPTNSTMIVKVQLLDFEETNREITILPPHEMEEKDTEAMLCKYNDLKTKIYYEMGRHLWEEMNCKGERIDFKLAKKSIEMILGKQRICSFDSMEEARDYSIQLCEYLRMNNPEIH